MKQTIAQGVIAEMQSKGHKFLGQTSGTYSFRKSSNLDRYLNHLGVTESDVIVKTGARAGKNRNDGYQLLVFSKAQTFPQTIYRTDENWGGEFYYYDRDDMQTCIDSLIEAGGEDWANISIGDCQTYELLKVLPDGRAAYKGAWITDGYNRNGRNQIVIFKPDGGDINKGDGGFIFSDHIDPANAYDREVMEELGLEIPYRFRS